MKNPRKIRIAACIAPLILAASVQAIPVTTVSAYDPNPNGVTLVDAASNATTGGITLTAFQSLVSSAYAAGKGGVIDAEAVNGMVPGTYYTSVDASLGATAASLNIARTDGGFGFDSGNDPTNAVSGTNYIGENSGNPTFAFARGLSAFGITMIPRSAVRTSQLVFTMDNGATYTTSIEAIDTTKTAHFFGALAPTGRTFTGVSMVETGGLVRYDDMGFVVAQAVPEPTTMAAFAVGGLACLHRRRRSNKVA